MPAMIRHRRWEVALPITSEWASGAWVGATQLLATGTVIEPAIGGRVVLPTGASLEIGPKALMLPVFARLTAGHGKLGPAGTRLKSGLVVQSQVLLPEIGSLPAGKEVSLALPLPRSTNIISLGLYEVAKNGKCSFVGSRTAGDRMTYGARRLLPLVMLDDRVPPKVAYKARRSLHHFGQRVGFRCQRCRQRNFLARIDRACRWPGGRNLCGPRPW
jgi:hypothetical protein